MAKLMADWYSESSISGPLSHQVNGKVNVAYDIS